MDVVEDFGFDMRDAYDDFLDDREILPETNGPVKEVDVEQELYSEFELEEEPEPVEAEPVEAEPVEAEPVEAIEVEHISEENQKLVNFLAENKKKIWSRDDIGYIVKNNLNDVEQHTFKRFTNLEDYKYLLINGEGAQISMFALKLPKDNIESKYTWNYSRVKYDKKLKKNIRSTHTNKPNLYVSDGEFIWLYWIFSNFVCRKDPDRPAQIEKHEKRPRRSAALRFGRSTGTARTRIWPRPGIFSPP